MKKEKRPPVLAAALALCATACFGRVHDDEVHDDEGTPAALSCSEQSAAATAQISAAFDDAKTDLSCTTDDDCVLVSRTSACTNSCGGDVLSIRGAKIVQAAIDDVGSGVCSGFAGQRCILGSDPCLVSGPPGAACVSGACVNFLPERWLSLTIDQRRGADSTFTSLPPTCAAGHECTLWKITPDGTIRKTVSGVAVSVSLAAKDFSSLDAILRSVSFRTIFDPFQDFATPLTCDAPPSGVGVTLDLELDGGYLTGMDMTGCTLVGPAGNDVQRVYDIVRAY